MKTILHTYLIALLSATLFWSCQSDDLSDQIPNGGLADGEGVSVSIGLSVDDVDYGTDQTRASTRADEDEDGILSDIKNLLILQFSGLQDLSILQHMVYIDDLSEENIDALLMETSSTTEVLFIANTFGDHPFVEGDYLGDVKSMEIALSGVTEQTVDGVIYDTNLVKTDDNGNKYFMMSGCYTFEDGIRTLYDQTGTTALENQISVSMKRNVAKITLNITNEWEGAEIERIGLYSIPYSYLYYANQHVDEHSSDELLIPATVTIITSCFNSYFGDFICSDVNAPVEKTIEYYVPVNMRGTVSEATALTKPIYAPDNATYAKIRVSADEIGYGQSYDYSLYLGADLVNDYNLKPNTHYIYNVTFKGMGDSNVDTDSRVTVYAKSETDDYTTQKSSNCYILNPSPANESVYYIPIAPRINEYWRDYVGNSTNVIYDNDITSWSFEILWYDNDENPYSESDINLNSKKLSIQRILKGTEGATPSLIVTLGEGFDNMGNILLAVKNSQGSILWSWHLWITDYDPYYHEYTETGIGAYPVENGDLHRYEGTLWEGDGIYAKKYMMDRNIGARSARPMTTDGFLYYEFGRKDPFPLDGNAKTIDDDNFDYNVSTSVVAMSTAVGTPTTYYAGSSNWCNEYTGNKILWNDPNLTDLTAGEKSIFDPSPYGFRLPIYDVWGMLSSTNFIGNASSYEIYSAGHGFYYTGDSDIYYPACGYLVNSTGVMGTDGKRYWSLMVNFSSTPSQSVNTYTHGHVIYAGNGSSDALNSQNYFFRTSGASLRCIEDVEEEQE